MQRWIGIEASASAEAQEDADGDASIAASMPDDAHALAALKDVVVVVVVTVR